jgi:serine/threonine protein kinase
MTSKALSLQTREYAPHLARLLRKAGEHEFRTLQLKSYAWDPDHTQCVFIFEYPAHSGNIMPQSLYDLICSTEPDFKLELGQRFHLARTVASSIGALHCDGWLHKSIRAEAIKFFFDERINKWHISEPYLTGFEMSRPDSATTGFEATALDVEFDVYRHPQRYGLPDVRFNKTHDIYSLGVLLLEIGLWKTAKGLYDGMIKDKYDGKGPAAGVKATEIREMLITHARLNLKHQMGLPYQTAVLSCLNCDLDDFLYSGNFASEFQVQVVERVNMKSLLSSPADRVTSGEDLPG